ncbi:MAG TPA: hypothetical protein VK449_09705 [Anaerolineales bacterium]|nr:hypothetical protein [Anaerolineales bacterium]
MEEVLFFVDGHSPALAEDGVAPSSDAGGSLPLAFVKALEHKNQLCTIQGKGVQRSLEWEVLIAHGFRPLPLVQVGEGGGRFGQHGDDALGPEIAAGSKMGEDLNGRPRVAGGLPCQFVSSNALGQVLQPAGGRLQGPQMTPDLRR